MSYATRTRDDVIGVYVTRSAALPVGTGLSEDLFSVTGHVLITSFFGRVTVAIPNVSLDFDLGFDPDDGGADVALATLLAVDNVASGTHLVLNATTGGALVAGVDVSDGVLLAKPLSVIDGDIKLNVAGGGAIGTDCRITWGLSYVPLNATGAVVAV